MWIGSAMTYTLFEYSKEQVEELLVNQPTAPPQVYKCIISRITEVKVVLVLMIDIKFINPLHTNQPLMDDYLI